MYKPAYSREVDPIYRAECQDEACNEWITINGDGGVTASQAFGKARRWARVHLKEDFHGSSAYVQIIRVVGNVA